VSTVKAMIRRPRDDHGRIAVFFAILAPAFLAMIGLVVDGGGKIRALQRADNIAAEAARAAGQAINAGQAISGGAKVIDPAAAATAAQQYINALDGVTGSVTTIDRTHLRVSIAVQWNPMLLDLFGGAGAATVRGQATATLVAQ
jgi:Flp pilus assembly protein TadG